MKEDFVRARADWERVMQLDPGNANIRRLLEALRQIGY
jgi:cytochrome c-type biogenesis protein CcmH/NrfG